MRDVVDIRDAVDVAYDKDVVDVMGGTWRMWLM